MKYGAERCTTKYASIVKKKMSPKIKMIEIKMWLSIRVKY